MNNGTDFFRLCVWSMSPLGLKSLKITQKQRIHASAYAPYALFGDNQDLNKMYLWITYAPVWQQSHCYHNGKSCHKNTPVKYESLITTHSNVMGKFVQYFTDKTRDGHIENCMSPNLWSRRLQNKIFDYKHNLISCWMLSDKFYIKRWAVYYVTILTTDYSTNLNKGKCSRRLWSINKGCLPFVCLPLVCTSSHLWCVNTNTI